MYVLLGQPTFYIHAFVWYLTDINQCSAAFIEDTTKQLQAQQ